MTCRVERLETPISDSDVHQLAKILCEAVEEGAAVSFCLPFSVEQAAEWWCRIIDQSHSRAIFLVARDRHGIAGTVHIQPAWAPNQPHRGEVVKLLVDRRCRGLGLGTQLMRAIEAEAIRCGYRLLTLNAKRGGVADRLYRRLDWTLLGTISEYALDSDGTPHDAVFYYKHVGSNELGRLEKTVSRRAAGNDE